MNMVGHHAEGIETAARFLLLTFQALDGNGCQARVQEGLSIEAAVDGEEAGLARGGV
jgi:hypothetical protein